jgi:uncharacterized membrane protein YvlD (DUF360 family)
MLGRWNCGLRRNQLMEQKLKLKDFLLRWLKNLAGVALAAWWVKGIHSYNLVDLLMATFLLSLLHFYVRPVVKLFLRPLAVLTLGFVNLIINALLLYVVGRVLAPNFEVATFGAAFWGGVVVMIVSAVIFLVLQVFLGVRVLRGAVRPAAPPPRAPNGPPAGTGPVIDI